MRLFKLIGCALVVAALGAAALLGWVVRGLYVPADPAGAVRPFAIAAGEPLAKVVRRLDDGGLLPRRVGFSPRVVVAYARLRGLDREVKTGEYALSPALTPSEILAKICAGSVQTYAVTLPEGLNVWEISKRLEESGIAPQRALLELALSKQFAAQVGVSADSLEGYLYPETYRFERDSDPAATLRKMVDQFHSNWTDADRELAARSGRTLHEVVSLASIVEKETGAAEERPRIAAVFLNRLSRGMRLQSDPTVIYGILLRRGGFDGNLRKADLEADTPYNTYRRAGIPPGPIASVSIDAIRAVLAPDPVKFLYFVSRNDGTHQFSSTLVEHNQAVQRYQKRGGRPAARPGTPASDSAFSAEAKRPRPPGPSTRR